MASGHWYVLKVRSRFAQVVAQKLRQLNFETIVLDPKFIKRKPPLRKLLSTDYVYCRFALEDRLTVTDCPGVLDIVGAPKPIPIDSCVLLQTPA